MFSSSINNIEREACYTFQVFLSTLRPTELLNRLKKSDGFVGLTYGFDKRPGGISSYLVKETGYRATSEHFMVLSQAIGLDGVCWKDIRME